MLKKTKQVRWWIGLSGMIAVLGMPMPTMADDSESMRKLRIAAALIRSEGYSCRNRVGGKRLNEDGSYTVKTTLYSGNDYAIIGAGDSDVRDLDIELYDENFNLIDRDTQDDALPIVKVSPRWSGRFYIRATMYRGYGYSNVMICSK
jgi:hypothetical protein